MILHRQCQQCGKSFDGGPRAWYCPDCRSARKREVNRAFRQNGPARPLGSVDHCVRCGQGYIVRSGMQKYCPQCAPEAIREIDTKQGMEYYNTHKNRLNALRNEVRRKITTCIVCGKSFPANGSNRNTCSDECWRERKHQLQKYYDSKRARRKKDNTMTKMD